MRCTGADGAATSVVFVTEPALVQVRPGEHAGRSGANSGDPVGLISDPPLLQRWLAALNELDRSLDDRPTARAAPTVPGGGNSGSGTRGTLRIDTDENRWLTYTDEAKRNLGPAVFHFVMGGLPGLRAAAGMADTGLLEPTDKLIDPRRAEQGTDSAGEPEPDPPPDSPEGEEDGAIPQVPPVPEHRRSWARRHLTAMGSKEELEDRPAYHRVTVLTLVLLAIQAGVWDSPVGTRG